MLRPKQLLPFAKATQRWVLAGTSAGTRTGDGTCHPHGVSNADDKEGENGRKSTPTIPSSGQVQGVQRYAPSETSSFSSSPDRRALPPHTVPIAGLYIKESSVDGAVIGSGGTDQHGKANPKVGGSVGSSNSASRSTQNVGLAVVGGLSTADTVHPTVGNRASNYRLVCQQSNPVTWTNFSGTANDKGTKDLPASNSGKEVPSLSKGVAAPSNINDSQQRSVNYGASHNGGGHGKTEWQARSSQPKPSSFHLSSIQSSSQTSPPSEQALSNSMPRQLSPGVPLDLTKDHLRQVWNSKEQHSRGGQTGRSQTGSRRQSHRAAFESGASNGESGAAKREIVDHVCNILRQLNWRPDTLVALSHVNRTLSSFHINEVLKHQKEATLALKFFDWAKGQVGYKHDVCTYTTMIGILGRARNFEACSGLLEEMRREGCEPCVVTYNRLIHAYGRANYLGEAMRIFHRMQEDGCSPDRVTYCTLVDLHSKAGFHDTAMDMYRQMQEAGFQPDTFTYSVVIHCLGKAGKVNAAVKLFQEMIERGCVPSLVTYNIIIGLQAKAGNHVMAMKLYNDMQDVGFHPDRVTYGIMLEVLGQTGHMEEAEHVIQEMEQAGWMPDVPIYGSMVDMWGKTGNADKAWEWFQKLLSSGLTPNVQVSNSLLGAYLRMHHFDSAREVLKSMSTWGLVPTLQTHTILLSSCTASAQHHQVVSLMANTLHPVYTFVCMLLSREVPPLELKQRVQQFFDTLHGEDHDSKRGFTDALIEFLHNLGRRPEAGLVWEVAREHDLYPLAVREKAKNQYSINLHVMSMGTALVALSRTLSGFRETMLYTGKAPERIEIITGWGKHSRVTGSSLVRQGVQNLLTALGSPFFVDSSNMGCFVSYGKPLSTWLHQPHVEQMLLL